VGAECGICFFGRLDEGYPKSDVILKGLEHIGRPAYRCVTSSKRRLLARYAILLVRYLTMKRSFSVLFVPQFRHKDVVLASILAKLTGKRVVFDPLVSRFDTKIMDRGDAGVRSFQAWHNRNLDKIALTLSDMVLADTGAHAEYFAAEFGVSPSKVRVLPVGVDESLFSPPAEALRQDGRFRVLFFGNYLPLHGADTIVDAAAMLLHREDIEFIMIGDGQTFPSVQAKVIHDKLTNVKLLPRVPIDELASRIAESDVCLGIFGTTPKAGRVVANKVYQSMAVGKPVITADSAAVRELFTDGDDICLVQPASAEALAARIDELHANPGTGVRIGERAARTVHERFSSTAIAGKLLEYCRELS